MHTLTYRSALAIASLVAASTAVHAANRAPTISGTPAVNAQVQQAYRFVALARDADGERMTFNIVNKPTWASFDSTSGALTGSPSARDVGKYNGITISASDGKTVTTLPAFGIRVVGAASAANSAPILSGQPAKQLSAGSVYSFQPTASDPNGDLLVFSITDKPTWATFNSTSGALTGSPSAGDVGKYNGITISASDGKTATTLPAFGIRVVGAASAANSAPILSGQPAKQLSVGSVYSFQPTASDPNGDRLVFSITDKPTWATFNSTSGALTGSPSARDVGKYNGVTISASDGKTATTLPAFGIRVVGAASAANSAPILSGQPTKQLSAGSVYSFQPTASDPNGDALAFSIANKPSWATFSTLTGKLSGAPQSADAATYSNIAISVSDGKVVTTLPAFSIAVTRVTVGNASLSWTAPTQNTDGSPLMDLGGYRIYYGTSASALNQVIDVPGASTINYVVDYLSSGSYYFAVKAVSAVGTESAMSVIGTKTIQ